MHLYFNFNSKNAMLIQTYYQQHFSLVMRHYGLLFLLVLESTSIINNLGHIKNSCVEEVLAFIILI